MDSESEGISTRIPSIKGAVLIFVLSRKGTLYCACCGLKEVKPKGKVRVRFKSIPIGCKAVFIILMVQPVLCLACGALRQVKVGDALEHFWKRLRRSKARKIKAVAIDMSPAYISAVIANLPDAFIVFDYFHIIKLFNEQAL